MSKIKPYLKISVNDGVAVKIIHGTSDLSAVESGPLFGELAFPSQMVIKLSAIDKFCDKTQPIHSSEGVLESQQKWVISLLKHSFFSHRVLHFVLFDDHFFLQDLHGVKLIGRLFAAQNHFAEGTFAQNLEKLKVFECLEWK